MVSQMVKKENVTRILEVFDRISKVFASMESFAGDLSLSKPELLALEAISNLEGLKMSELAGRLEIGMSTATGIIDRLIEKKLVLREKNGTDRRVVRIVLTGRGKKTNLVYQKQKKEIFQKMLSQINTDEQKSFILILEKISNALE
jgi:DNA-binding MarR family transcriptional regulator